MRRCALAFLIGLVGCRDSAPDVAGSGSTGSGTSEGSSEGSTGFAPPEGPLLEADCDPIGGYCGLPFPSDVYLVDGAVRFGVATLPKVAGRTPIDPADYTGFDGWSVASSPMTFLPGATRTGLATPATLATSVEPDSPTVLLNTETGEHVAHFVDVDVSASGPEKALIVRPGAVLEYSTRYVVAVRNVVDAAGSPLLPPEAFAALRDGTEHADPSVASRRYHYQQIFADLETAGVARENLQIAWDFTTGSRESITGPLLAVRDAALAAVGDDGPEFVITEVVDDPNPMLRHRVIVTATVPRFISEHVYEAGEPPAVLQLDEAGGAVQNGTMEMEVLIQIPNSIDDGDPHGILQNGHGFLGRKEEGADGYQAMAADGWGWVTVAVDLFGLSQPDLAVIAEGLVVRPELLSGFIARQIQGHANQLLAMRMMIGRVAQNGIVDDTGRVLLDPARIDPTLVAYRGDSQGGTMGGVYMSISTDVTRGLLGEPGVGFSWIWQRSVDADTYSTLIKQGYPNSPLDFQILLQLIQLHWDRSEPSGFIANMHRDPLPNTPAHHVLMHTGIGDHEVATIVSHAAARTIGVSLVRSDDANNPFPRAVFGLAAVDPPTEGISGLIEYDFALPPEPQTNVPAEGGCNPHDRVRELTPSFEQQDRFFRTGRIAWFCDGICNCDGPRAEDRCAESSQQECG